MKYTHEQRLEIGKEIYTRNISINEAANKYQINPYTARAYMREYRDKNQLPPIESNTSVKLDKSNKIEYPELMNLSKQELIDEIIKARVEAERAKKGYKVEGGGQEKEFKDLKKMSLK